MKNILDLSATLVLFWMVFLSGCWVADKALKHNKEKPVADAPVQEFESRGEMESVCVIHATKCTQPQQANPGSVIRWRGAENPGASPLNVLRATKDQMEREQKTKLGSDATARAMVLVMQAIAELEGKQTEMPDGTPIIQ